MITFLLGSDDFSKKNHITLMHKQRGGDLDFFTSGDQIPLVSQLTEADLFSRPKMFVFEGVIPEMGERVEKLVKSPNHVVASVISLDKRKKENKELLQRKDITVLEFKLPHGKEFDQWLMKRAKTLGAELSPQAADALAKRLGRDESQETKFGGKVVDVKEAFSLWQADSELQKLLAYAGEEQVKPEDIQKLVHTELEVDALEITNAIGDKDKQRTLSLIQKFLDTENAADEKGGIIQLSALLGEQFRSVAIAQSFLEHKAAETEILEQTGWKSGRLFIMKKVAARYPAKTILDTLRKLYALDTELKTSSTPPKVLLDLIVAQLF